MIRQRWKFPAARFLRCAAVARAAFAVAFAPADAIAILIDDFSTDHHYAIGGAIGNWTGVHDVICVIGPGGGAAHHLNWTFDFRATVNVSSQTQGDWSSASAMLEWD